ncbi:hypothetical protein IE53DRAFT_366045 [Violaceomyces palustris]|uniref:Uncharacterized protein n=1 Tax=Violaceomyces palustris TaxID=1673888 RepID=A0ACD0P6V2_9BASI|nr:hypothetical protein IE53DRAFT_366045 [Violaceomyces palustris]
MNRSTVPILLLLLFRSCLLPTSAFQDFLPKNLLSVLKAPSVKFDGEGVMLETFKDVGSSSDLEHLLRYHPHPTQGSHHHLSLLRGEPDSLSDSTARGNPLGNTRLLFPVGRDSSFPPSSADVGEGRDLATPSFEPFHHHFPENRLRWTDSQGIHDDLWSSPSPPPSPARSSNQPFEADKADQVLPKKGFSYFSSDWTPARNFPTRVGGNLMASNRFESDEDSFGVKRVDQGLSSLSPFGKKVGAGGGEVYAYSPFPPPRHTPSPPPPVLIKKKIRFVRMNRWNRLNLVSSPRWGGGGGGGGGEGAVMVEKQTEAQGPYRDAGSFPPGNTSLLVIDNGSKSRIFEPTFNQKLVTNLEMSEERSKASYLTSTVALLSPPSTGKSLTSSESTSRMRTGYFSPNEIKPSSVINQGKDGWNPFSNQARTATDTLQDSLSRKSSLTRGRDGVGQEVEVFWTPQEGREDGAEFQGSNSIFRIPGESRRGSISSSSRRFGTSSRSSSSWGNLRSEDDTRFPGEKGTIVESGSNMAHPSGPSLSRGSQGGRGSTLSVKEMFGGGGGEEGRSDSSLDWEAKFDRHLGGGIEGLEAISTHSKLSSHPEDDHLRKKLDLYHSSLPNGFRRVVIKSEGRRLGAFANHFDHVGELVDVGVESARRDLERALELESSSRKGRDREIRRDDVERARRKINKMDRLKSWVSERNHRVQTSG